MELRKWKEYTDKEKKELLLHWFQCYGRLLYSENEFDEFERLVEIDADLMFDMAVGSFCNKCGIPAFLVGIRTNSLTSFLNSILEMRTRPGYENWFSQNSFSLLINLVKTLNNPESLESVFFDADLERQTESIVNMSTGRFR